MAFEFVETLTLEIPNVEAQMAAFTEGEGSNHGLIIELAAIHEGVTSNFNHYSEEELQKALESWVSPYPKPIIMNHDPESEPVGRIMQAKMDREADGTPYVRLQAAITDPEAIKKIMDKRYLTGSVGGKSSEAICSICGANWANASMFNIPCKHARGKTYKGKVAQMEMKNIGFKEYSFVNMPADQHSGVRTVGTGATTTEESPVETDGWVKARIFDLNMDKQEISELTESETLDVLSGMSKKNAGPLYHNLRGAFLSALAISESEIEELNGMDEEVLDTEEEDILAVTEELSSDLAVEAEVEPEEEASDEAPAAEEEEEIEDDAEDTTDADDSDPEVEEFNGDGKQKKAEGQEKPDSVLGLARQDIDPETSKGAPINRQSDDTEDTVSEDETAVAELNERITTLESLVAEAETLKQSLLDENAKLKTALKKSLVERVVDTKISLSLEEKDNRTALIEEHMGRTSRSLADSLRDLATMKPAKKEVTDYSGLTMENVTMATDDPYVAPISDEVIEQHKLDPEDFFVDVLMGRRKLSN